MALPGGKKPKIQKKPTKKAPKKPADGAQEESKLAGATDETAPELTGDDLKKMGDELKGLSTAHAQKQIEEIRKKRAEESQEEKPKKGDADTRIDVKELKTEVEARKGGMPEHIAALPENHPIRLRWEKGFRQREDGTWYKVSNEELADHVIISEDKQRAFLLIPLIVLGLLILIGGNWYSSQLTSTREDIIKTVKLKGIKDKPETKKQLQKAYKSQWLPELKTMLKEFKKVKRDFGSFVDNAESGSYIQHIKKHNKKFDAEEAMQWRTRIIRKPSD
ncbi:MAG: hypothetical protein HQL70_11915 [Magnetococcales bacterium]|nr:hypothetical protein [Magnetococcales bacterium]